MAGCISIIDNSAKSLSSQGLCHPINQCSAAVFQLSSELILLQGIDKAYETRIYERIYVLMRMV